MNIGFDIPEGSSGIVIIPNLLSNYRITDEKIIENDIPYTHPGDSKEILGLCGTLDYNIAAIFSQNMQKPNPTYYLGRGKVEEIADWISAHSTIDFAVVDCHLKPNQVFNLETKLGLRVIDRSTIILIIFLHHAKTKEAKLQVEYAILKHQLPYVTELVRKSKKGEHPGFMAGGEYKVDEYYRLTKTRVKTIRNELEKVKTSRSQQRKHRRRKGFVLASLAGYTNAGKSSLLKALTDAQVPVDDRMFSTVSPKTRRFRRSNVLFTDTVGFIQDIPTQLIEAFKSTLEEIIDADYILLVVDISEEPRIVKNKVLTCLNTIGQLLTEQTSLIKNISQPNIGITKRPRYSLVFNKLDLSPEGKTKADQIINDIEETLSSHKLFSVNLVSCKTKQGIEKMIKNIYNMELEKI